MRRREPLEEEPPSRSHEADFPCRTRVEGLRLAGSSYGIPYPEEGKGHDKEHRRQHVDDGKNFDAAHAKPCGYKDDASAGGEVIQYRRRHLRRKQVDGEVQKGQNEKLRHGDQADGKAEQRSKNKPAEEIENCLGYKDGRIAGHPFIDGSKNAHTAETKGGNKGDDIDDIGFIAAVPAFGEPKEGSYAPGEKGFGKKELPHTGAQDESHDHHREG